MRTGPNSKLSSSLNNLRLASSFETFKPGELVSNMWIFIYMHIYVRNIQHRFGMSRFVYFLLIDHMVMMMTTNDWCKNVEIGEGDRG